VSVRSAVTRRDPSGRGDVYLTGSRWSARHDTPNDSGDDNASRGRRPPVLRRLHHRALDGVSERARRIGTQVVDGPRPLRDVLEKQRHRVPRLERHTSGQHLVAEDADGVDVAAPIELPLAHRLLGRHVGRRADGDTRRRESSPRLRGPGDAEVRHHRAARLAVEQDVVGLDVTVDDTAKVRVGERVGDFGEDAPHFIEWLARLAREVRREVAASDERHDEPGDPFALADIVDGNDVRVRQLRGHLRLAREAGADGGIVRELGWQHLDRDGPIQAEVPGAVDHGHSATANLGLELVVRTDGGNDAVVQGLAHLYPQLSWGLAGEPAGMDPAVSMV
jgi:hypothetical protein